MTQSSGSAPSSGSAQSNGSAPAKSSAPGPTPDTAPKVVLCVPGPWADHAELVRGLRDADLSLDDNSLQTKQGHILGEVDVQNADPRVSDAFASAGAYWRTTEEMRAVAAHKRVVYLIGDGGSREKLERLMRAAGSLLDAGGLGVKVENSGAAHSPAIWRAMIGDIAQLTVHHAFVSTLLSGKEAYTCGMQSFGLYDVRANRNIPDVEQAVRAFSVYLLAELPTVEAGQIVRLTEDGPDLRVEAAEPIKHKEHLLRNRYGTWRLAAAY